MPDKPTEPAQSKLFSVPVLIVFVAAIAAFAYAIPRRGKARSIDAAAPEPTFTVHTGPPSAKLPSDAKYSHVQGAWCSYAGDVPVYFCGKDQAACEAAGPGSVCIQGGQSFWCLERFDANDGIDRADCYWTPKACNISQARHNLSNTLRVECKEFSRN
jgi:hypothetical protein